MYPRIHEGRGVRLQRDFKSTASVICIGGFFRYVRELQFISVYLSLRLLPRISVSLRLDFSEVLDGIQLGLDACRPLTSVSMQTRRWWDVSVPKIHALG